MERDYLEEPMCKWEDNIKVGLKK